MGQATSRSWKQGGPRAEAPPDKATRRWAVTLLSAILIAILGVVLWSLFRPQTKAALLVLAPSEFDALELPLEFVEEDLAWTKAAPHVERRPFPDFSPDQVAEDLRKLNLNENDTLIVYVIANGISDPDGPAFVISGGRKRPVAPFLKAVAEAKARMKLVVMDCQRLRVDTRRGLYPNRFADDLARELRELSGKNVFVLTTGRADDVTSTLPSPANQRTLFGQALEVAAKETSQKSEVTLGEFVGSLKQEMAKYLKRASVSQVPVVFELGRGEAARDRMSVTMASLGLPQPKPEPPPATDVQPKPAPKPETEKPKPVADPFKFLDEAWTLRDKLQSPRTAHSPVIFAPHIWREVQATLADLELRLRAGSATRPGAADESQTIARELAELDNAISKGGPIRSQRNSPMGRLISAWSEYQGDSRFISRWRASRDQDEKLDQDVFRAYAAAVSEVPWVVDLADQLHVRGVGIAGELDLRPVLNAIEAFQQQVLERDGRPADAVLVELRDRLNATRTELRAPFLQVALDATAESVDGKLNLREQRVLDTILRSPLWSLADRKKFRTALLKPTEFSEHVSASDVDSGAGGQSLEGKAQTDLLAHVRNLLEGDSQDDLDVRLVTFHDSRLPRIREAGEDRRLRPWQVHQLLAFVDPRNADEYPTVDQGILQISLPARERWDVVWTPESVEVPGPGKQVPVTAEIERKRGEPRSKVSLVVSFDPALRVSHAGRVIDNGATIPVSLVDGQTRLSLQVQANGIQPDGSAPGKIRVSVLDGEVPLGDGFVECRLPTERRIELVATSTAFSGDKTGTAGSLLSIPVFPNRQTPWQFQLRNRSKNARTVNVQFFALPQSAVTERPGELNRTVLESLVEQGFPARNGTPLNEVAGITLAPNELRDLSPPPAAAAPAKEGAPAAPAPEKTAEASAPKPGIDVSPGLVCVVREVGSAGPPDLYWIGWQWLKPRDYLKVEATYVARRAGNFRVRIEPSGVGPLPPGLDTQGIRIRGRIDRTEDYEGSDPQEEGLNAELTAKRPVGEVLTDLPVGNTRRRFVLDVDGWPRAFVFDVDCAESDNPVPVPELRQSRSSAQIAWVQVDGQAKQYHPGAMPEFLHELETVQSAPPPANGPAPTLPLLLKDDAAAAFKPGKDLFVRLEVDLPESRQPGDQLVLRKRPSGDATDEGASQQRVRPVDREYRCELMSFVNGAVSFATRVDDLTVTFPITGRRGRDELQLSLNGYSGAGTQSQLEVILDNQAPQVAPNGVSTRPTGGPNAFDVELTTEDPGGAGTSRVQLFLVDKGQLDGTEKPVVATLTSTEKWSAGFNAAKLPPDSDYFVFVKAADRAGNEMARISGPHPIRIPRPAAPVKPTTPAGKPKATIVGEVLFGESTNRLEKITVTVVETGDQVTTGSDGRFEFKGLDPGNYTLKAEGSVQGSDRIAQKSGVKATPEKETPKTVIIRLVDKKTSP